MAPPRCCIAGLVSIAFLSAVALGQDVDKPIPTPPKASPAADDEVEREALRALLPIYEQAVNQGKLSLLEPFLAPEFTAVVVTGEEIDSFNALNDYWGGIQELLGEDGTYQVKVNVDQPAYLAAETAVATGTTNDKVVTSAGNEFEFTSRWTAVLCNRSGEWKILRIHASMDPINNSFVKMARRTLAWTCGIIASLAGLLAGWSAHRMIVKRGSSEAGTA